MERRFRATKEDEFELGYVFERMVTGMRNEMNSVLWKIERSRDISPEALKNMIKTGLEAMVGAVEKVMNGVSDGIVKERKEKDWEESRREERAKKADERIEQEMSDIKEKGNRSEERLRTLEVTVGRKDLEDEVCLLYTSDAADE